MRHPDLFDVQRSAVFGPENDNYRYELWRLWDVAKPVIVVCMLNCSTAIRIDHTIEARSTAGGKKW